MKNVKSYKLFLEDKKVEDNDSLRNTIIQFLISQEKISGLHFSNFDLIKDDKGREKFIIAYTQNGPNGEKPPMDKRIFDIIDYYTWGLESKYGKGDYEFDNTWRSPRLKTLVTALKDMKTNILREIVCNDITKKQVEPNNDDKKLIDKIFNSSNVWENVKKKSQEILSIINKYDIEEIEDRSLEFTDEVTGWNPRIMFAWYYSNGWHGLKGTEDIDDTTCRLIWDAWYQINSTNTKVKTIEQLLKAIKPCIYFDLTDGDGYKPKNLLELEKIADRMVNRFKQLYDIEDFILPYHRETRQYDPNSDVTDYLMTFIIK